MHPVAWQRPLILLSTFVAVFLVWFAPKTVRAQQEYTISGVLLDEDDNPMAVVRVALDTATSLQMSSLDGEFNFKAKPGKHTILVAAFGYQDVKLPVEVIDKDITGLEIKLKPIESNVEEVVITAKNNPAIRIMKLAIKNKKDNRMEDIDCYEYESYNKLVFTMDNITDEKINSLMLKPMKKFIEDNKDNAALLDTAKIEYKLDSTGAIVDTLISHPDSLKNKKRYKLAVYITESVSNIYYKKPNKKEVMVAQNTAGIEIAELSILSSTLLTKPNIYDNYVEILGKQFVSPLASSAFIDYHYYLKNFVANANDTLFCIEIIPKSDYSKTFKGYLFIENKDWAVVRVDLSMNSDPNINFVEDIIIRQEYEKTGEDWIVKINDLTVDFKNGDEKVGLVGRAVSVTSNYIRNQPKEDKFYNQEDLEIMGDAAFKDSTYWANKRATPLENSEKLGFELIETMKKMTFWKVLTTMSQLFTTGKKRFGKIEVGPYVKLFAFNPIEGPRVQLGANTNVLFSDRWYLGGWLGYGFKDKRLKYNAEVRYKLVYKPRLEIGLSHTYDTEQTGFKNYDIDGAGLLNSLLMRVPLYQLNYFRETNFNVYSDVTKGLALWGYVKMRSFEPGSRFPLTFNPEDMSPGTQPYSNFNNTEAGISARISFREQYILKGGDKVYLGSDFPQIYLEGKMGIKGFLGGQFQYYSASISVCDRMKLGRLGYINYTLSYGKIWGTLPMPLLYVYRGNQSFAFDPNGYNFGALGSVFGARNRSAIFDPVSFNLMYFYEFIADQYALAAIDWHLDGWLFSKIPLWRKLKLKEVLTARVGWGTLTQKNIDVNNTGLVELQAPTHRPYIEVGAGIENIFKVMRVDFVWRLTYKNPTAPGPLAGYNYNWGPRVNLNISF